MIGVVYHTTTPLDCSKDVVARGARRWVGVAAVADRVRAAERRSQMSRSSTAEGLARLPGVLERDDRAHTESSGVGQSVRAGLLIARYRAWCPLSLGNSCRAPHRVLFGQQRARPWMAPEAQCILTLARKAQPHERFKLIRGRRGAWGSYPTTVVPAETPPR
jgi:hypothetical protein